MQIIPVASDTFIDADFTPIASHVAALGSWSTTTVPGSAVYIYSNALFPQSGGAKNAICTPIESFDDGNSLAIIGGSGDLKFALKTSGAEDYFQIFGTNRICLNGDTGNYVTYNSGFEYKLERVGNVLNLYDSTLGGTLLLSAASLSAGNPITSTSIDWAGPNNVIYTFASNKYKKFNGIWGRGPAAGYIA